MGKGPYATFQGWVVVTSKETVDSTYSNRWDARERARVCNLICEYEKKPKKFFVRPAVVLIETGGKG